MESNNVNTFVASKKYKLTYFDIRGRAEPIRLLFAVAQVPFEDKRIAGQEWPSLKSQTPWGQLPMLEMDILEEGSSSSNLLITQSMAIIRFLAKKFDLYSSDHYLAAQIDEIGYVIGELVAEWYKFVFESDVDKRSTQKGSLMDTHFPNYFEKLSRFHLKHGGPYLLGEKLTFSDVMLAELLDAMEEEGLEGVVDQYPVMRELKDTVWSIPSVKAYVEQRSRM